GGIGPLVDADQRRLQVEGGAGRIVDRQHGSRRGGGRRLGGGRVCRSGRGRGGCVVHQHLLGLPPGGDGGNDGVGVDGRRGRLLREGAGSEQGDKNQEE